MAHTAVCGIVQRVLCDWCQSDLSACVVESSCRENLCIMLRVHAACLLICYLKILLLYLSRALSYRIFELLIGVSVLCAVLVNIVTCLGLCRVDGPYCSMRHSTTRALRLVSI